MVIAKDKGVYYFQHLCKMTSWVLRGREGGAVKEQLLITTIIYAISGTNLFLKCSTLLFPTIKMFKSVMYRLLTMIVILGKSLWYKWNNTLQTMLFYEKSTFRGKSFLLLLPEVHYFYITAGFALCCIVLS